IVSGRDNEGIAGIDLSLRAIPADDFQASLDHVPHVLSLAAISLRNRLDVLGPFPARLMMRADDGHAVNVDDLELAPAERSRFVRSVELLLVNRCLLLRGTCVCHSDLLLNLASVPAAVPICCHRGH